MSRHFRLFASWGCVSRLIRGRTIWIANAYHGQRFIVRTNERADGVSKTRIGDSSLRRIASTKSESFPKLAGYETKHFISSSCVVTRLVRARAERAGGKSTSRRWLFRRKHG